MEVKTQEGITNARQLGVGKMTPEEREKTRRALLDYCGLDTYAMVKVWEKLVEVSRK